MYSSITNSNYYIGTQVKDIYLNKYGIIYAINVLGTNGIRVRFSDNTKKVYFNSQLLDLEIVS